MDLIVADSDKIVSSKNFACGVLVCLTMTNVATPLAESLNNNTAPRRGGSRKLKGVFQVIAVYA